MHVVEVAILRGSEHASAVDFASLMPGSGSTESGEDLDTVSLDGAYRTRILHSRPYIKAANARRCWISGRSDGQNSQEPLQSVAEPKSPLSDLIEVFAHWRPTIFSAAASIR